jgi:hypothetical protein
MKNTSIKISLYSALVLFTLGACKKDKKEDPSPQPATQASTTGTFMLHFHTNIDTNEVESYGEVYMDANGRKISLDMAQLYISEIQLVKSDGSLVNFSGVKIMKVLDTESYMVGSAPVGSYKSFRFKVGLDSLTNTESSTIPSDSALLNQPAMWFGATAQPLGYVYLNVQGKIDTTTNASGAVADMQPFIYKIGTNAHYTQVIMPDKAFSIASGQTAFGHVTIDYSKLFTGIQLNVPANLSITTTTDNASSTANTVASSIFQMFSYEE